MKRTWIVLVVLSAFLAVACGDGKAPEVKPKAKPAVEKEEPKAEPKEEPKAEPKAEPKEEPKADASTDAAPVAAPKVDDVVTLAMEGAKKPTIKFPHKAHTEFEAVGGKCGVCHHVAGEDTSKIKGCMAEGCHDGKTEGAPSAKDAFHKTCRDCHKKALAANADNEKLKKIKSCSGCHAK